MSDYMASLQKLAQRSEGDLSAGPRRRGARGAELCAALHPPREGREASILHRLAKGEADIPPSCERSISVSIRAL